MNGKESSERLSKNPDTDGKWGNSALISTDHPPRLEEKKLYNPRKTDDVPLRMSQFLPFQAGIITVMEEAKEHFHLNVLYQMAKTVGQPVPILPAIAQKVEPIEELETFFQILADGMSAVLQLETVFQDVDFIADQIRNIILMLFALHTFVEQQSPDEARWEFKVKLLMLIHYLCLSFTPPHSDICALARENYYRHTDTYFTHGKMQEKSFYPLLDRAFRYPTHFDSKTLLQEMYFISRLMDRVYQTFSDADRGSQHQLLLRVALFSQKMIHLFFDLTQSTVLQGEKVSAYCLLVTYLLEVVYFYLNTDHYLSAQIFMEQVAKQVLNSADATTMNQETIHQKMHLAILDRAGNIVRMHAQIPAKYRHILRLAYQISRVFSSQTDEAIERNTFNPLMQKTTDKISGQLIGDPEEVKQLLICQSQPGGVTLQQRDRWLNKALRLCLRCDLQAEEKQVLEWLSLSMQVCQAYLSCRTVALNNMASFADLCVYLFLKYAAKIPPMDTLTPLIGFTNYLAECSLAEAGGLNIKRLSTLEQKSIAKVSWQQFMPLKKRLSAVIHTADKRLFLQKEATQSIQAIFPDADGEWLCLHGNTCLNKITIEKMLQLVEDAQDPEIFRNSVVLIVDFLITMVSLINGTLPQSTDFALKLEILAQAEEICLLFDDLVDAPVLRMRAYYLGINNYLHHRESDHTALDALLKKALTLQCPNPQQQLQEINLIQAVFQDDLWNDARHPTEVLSIRDQFSAKMVNLFQTMKTVDFAEDRQQQFSVYLKIVHCLLRMINHSFETQTVVQGSLAGLDSSLQRTMGFISRLHALTRTHHQADLLTEQHALAVLEPIVAFFKNRKTLNGMDKAVRKQLSDIVNTFTPKTITDQTLSHYCWSLKILVCESLKEPSPEKKAVPTIQAPAPITAPPPSPPPPSSSSPPPPRQPSPARAISPQPAEPVIETEQMAQASELKRINEQLIASSTAKTECIRKLKATSRNRKKEHQDQIKQLKADTAEREVKLKQHIAQLTQENQSLGQQVQYTDQRLTATQAELKTAQTERDQALKAAEALSAQLRMLPPVSAPPEAEILELKRALQETTLKLTRSEREVETIRIQSSQELKEALTKAEAKARQDQAVLVQKTIVAEHTAKYEQLKSYVARIKELEEENQILQQPGFYQAWQAVGFTYARGSLPQEPRKQQRSHATDAHKKKGDEALTSRLLQSNPASLTQAPRYRSPAPYSTGPTATG
jgi:hypothetical protein